MLITTSSAPDGPAIARRLRRDGHHTDGIAPRSEASTQETSRDAVPPCTLEVTIYGPTAYPNGFSALASEWNDLLARSLYDTFFLTHEWQSVWWQQLGAGELWILAFYQGENEEEGEESEDPADPSRPTPRSSELVGIAPFYLNEHKRGKWAGKRSLQLVGCVEVSDFLDIVIAAGREEQVYYCLLDWLQSEEAPAWDYLDLCNLPEDSLSYKALPSIFRNAGLRVEVDQEDVAPHVHLPAHYENYLMQIDKKQRHEIRRKQRRVERELEVGFTLIQSMDELQGAMDEFLRLQRMSRPDKETFMTPHMERFFRVMAGRMLEAGYLHLSFLSLNGENAAALLAFEYKKELLLYNSGYDTERWAIYSPGWVLLGYAIQHAIARGIEVFDFLQGDEEYKYRFGGQDYRVMRTLISNQRA
jgi:hypothetical protein